MIEVLTLLHHIVIPTIQEESTCETKSLYQEWLEQIEENEE